MQQASTEASLTTITPLSAYYTSICLLKTTIAAVSSDTTTAEGNILFDEGINSTILCHAAAG